MSIVYIEEKAFMAILVAAVEEFPSKYRPDCTRKPKGVSDEGEVHGLLFGQRMNKGNGEIFNVTLAVPTQVVYYRNENGVDPSMIHIDRVREITELFPTYQFLGCFHSHPYPRDKFHKKSSVMYSNDDRSSATWMASNLGHDIIEVIFGITCLKRHARTQPEYIGSHIIHNCCGVYKYSLACYKTSDKDLLEADNLICPVGSGMHFMDFKK